MKRALLLVLTAASFLLGAEQAQAGDRRGNFEAHGKGAFEFAVSGHMAVRLHGEGVLAIPHARRLHIRIHGRGDVRLTDDGTLLVSNFQGAVVIYGPRFRVRFRGGRVGVLAAGHGQGILAGRGEFRIGDRVGRWKPDGVRVAW